MKEKILIIIPAYNEEKNILKTYESLKKYSYDVLVVNDGSTDNTEEILINNNIKHIKLIYNLGIGGAMQTGYMYAQRNSYDYAVQFDGDGQHNAEYIENVLKPLREGKANLTIGSRFIEDKENFKSTGFRRAGIKVISSIIKLVTNKRIYDTTSGMRACDKKIIELFSEKYPIEYPEPVTNVDILLSNYKIEEVYVKMNEREHGKSSINSWKSFYYMVNVILYIIVLAIRRRK